MKSNKELRVEALKILRADGWMGKYLCVALTLAIFATLVQKISNVVIASCEMQTWSMFFEAKAKALASGLDLAVPSRMVMYRMNMATLFDAFLNFIASGICAFAIAAVFLLAAKMEKNRWFLRSLGGFVRPLDMAWLYFRYVLQISLWSLLFIIPGVVAVYRYSQCWNLKVEHPDWSAGKCLAVSGKMMRGNKWRLFSLQCSYWRPITLYLLLVLLITVMFAMSSSAFGGLLTSALGKVLLVVLMLLLIVSSVFLVVYIGIGQALFYLQIDQPKD